MGVQINVADVLEMVAFRLHLPAFGSGEFVSDAQALALVKSSAKRLSAMLVRSFGDDYFSAGATLTTQAGLDIVSLPPDLATVTAVYWVDSSGHAHRLEHSSLEDYQPTVEAWSGTCSRLPTFRVSANVLALQPVPNAVYTLRLEYQTGIFITSLTDTFQGQLGWDEWMCLDICEMARDREDKDASRFTARKAKIEYDLVNQAAQRDRNTPRTVVDTRGANSRRDGLFLGRSRRFL